MLGKGCICAYKRSVNPHHNVLEQLLSHKRRKENIESKPQCQKHSYSYHLHRETKDNHMEYTKKKRKHTLTHTEGNEKDTWSGW